MFSVTELHTQTTSDLLSPVCMVERWVITVSLTTNNKSIFGFEPLRTDLLDCRSGGRVTTPSQPSFVGLFGACQDMGLKILSNAKIKKPVDCSRHRPLYSSTAMDGGKLLA